MREIWTALRSERRRALVTVTRTLRSSPLPVGSSMVVFDDDSVVGNISGGCVDGDAFLLAKDVLATGASAVASYGVSNELAATVGLTCGGEIDVVITPGPSLDLVTFVLAHAERPPGAALVTVVQPAELRGRHLAVASDEVRGSVGDTSLDTALADRARALTALGCSGTAVLDRPEVRPAVEAVVQVAVPAPRMLIFGAVSYSAALARVGKMLGYHVTVCDARPVFATRDRVPDADDLVVAWPHRYLASTAVDSRTVICSLSHDAKFEIPLLLDALRGPSCYVGALGSRWTQAERVEALREAGSSDDELARLHAPIGLDLGARSPEETAISIAAEIVAVRSGASGTELRAAAGRIHPTEPR